ncbi:MAG: 6,7-dimethyl-8-ribityllumazine synthase [Chloroflexota bacterium]
MTTYAGKLDGEGLRLAMVVSRFNEFISERLLQGALDAAERHGVAPGDTDVVWVPGSFEIPVVARRLACSGRYQAIVCLGAVIRGATAHFEYVAGEAASGIAAVTRETGLPVIFGVLTTETVEQAMERAGGKGGNKGFQSAVSAIEMANLLRELPQG